MKRFALAILALATGVIVLVAVTIALSPSTFFAAWIMGSRHVSTVEHLQSSEANIVELGPAVHSGTTVVVPVELVAAKNAPIAGAYTRIGGRLIVAESYVYVDATYGIGKFGWRTRLPWHFGKDVVTVEFPADQTRILRQRFNVAECCTPPPWQWQSHRIPPEYPSAQAMAAARAEAESSVAQALAASRAESAQMSLDTATPLQRAILVARPGDSLLQFQSQLSPIAASDPTIKYELRRTELGVRLFLNADAKVKVVRLDWPFAGTIGGIKIGDSLEDTKRTLGEPRKFGQDEHQGANANTIFFEQVAGFPAQIDFDDAHRIATIILR